MKIGRKRGEDNRIGKRLGQMSSKSEFSIPSTAYVILDIEHTESPFSTHQPISNSKDESSHEMNQSEWGTKRTVKTSKNPVGKREEN